AARPRRASRSRAAGPFRWSPRRGGPGPPGRGGPARGRCRVGPRGRAARTAAGERPGAPSPSRRRCGPWRAPALPARDRLRELADQLTQQHRVPVAIVTADL
ncbi:MAG: hypothetical protein AVDCRST_MAG66-2254, partial [uncultured Pseudonocardia sp.]